uniref:CX domain-containing protein n=1 Tax=Parastrongyloides trichosuri TaxID=131310 RepID=A0A0N4ZJQ3_PARTI
MKLSEYKTRYLKEKILPEKLMSNHGEQEYTFGISCCNGNNCSKGYTANNVYLNMVANSYSANMEIYLPKTGEKLPEYMTRIGEMEKNMSNESPKYGKSPINISSGILGFMIYILLKY